VGVIYLFERAAGGWIEHARLAPSGLGKGAKFGQSSALLRDGLIVGAPGLDQRAQTQRDGRRRASVGGAFVYRERQPTSCPIP
jgi:hypothetical protein